MLQRIITILRECKEVWPLAARWVEALERFTLDPHFEAPAAEGSMADGKDPVPHAIRQTSPVAAAVPTPPQVSRTPSLPENGVLPRPEPSSALLSATHGAVASSISTSTNGQTMTPPSPAFRTTPQPLPHALFQQPDPPHQQRQQLRPGDSPLHGPAAPHHVYVSPQAPPPPLGRQPVDGLGMLIEAFDTHQPAATPYEMGGPPGSGPYYPQLGPGNDGFEAELQFYIDGAPSSWVNTGAWLDTMQ